jgi:hypothetical protein
MVKVFVSVTQGVLPAATPLVAKPGNFKTDPEHISGGLVIANRMEVVFAGRDCHPPKRLPSARNQVPGTIRGTMSVFATAVQRDAVTLPHAQRVHLMMAALHFIGHQERAATLVAFVMTVVGIKPEAQLMRFVLLEMPRLTQQMVGYVCVRQDLRAVAVEAGAY